MSEDTEDPVAFLHPVEIGDLFYPGPAIRAWIVDCEDDKARLQPVEVAVERCDRRAEAGAAQARAETHTRINRRPR
jgi:hypothetical protein